MRKFILPFPLLLLLFFTIAAIGTIQLGIKAAADHTRTLHAGICQPEELVSGQTGATLRVNCRGTRGYMRDRGRDSTRIIIRFVAGHRDPLRCTVHRDTTASCEPIARRHGS